MPIIETYNTDEPLNQGDILEGITLFSSLIDKETFECQHKKHETSLCLVVSRPCVALNEPQIIVAAIQKDKGNSLKPDDDFDMILDVLISLRDGRDAKDLFYLGCFEGKEGRYAARLDGLYTIQVPQPPEKKREFIKRSRKARLLPDFQRSLHSRIFQSFCTLGFEDYSWFVSQDLELLIGVAERDIQNYQSQIKLYEDEQKNTGQNFKNQISALQNKIKGVETKIAPYRSELAKRKA